MKIDLEQIEETLKKHNIDPETASKVIKELTEVIEEEKADKENSKVPKGKNEYLIILSDPEFHLRGIEDKFTGAVITQPVGKDAGTVMTRMNEAIQNYIQNRKRKRTKIESFMDALSALKAKNWKDKDIAVKTKEPVRILITNNKLP